MTSVVVLELLGCESMPLRGLMEEVFLEGIEKEEEKGTEVDRILEMGLEKGDVLGED